MGVDIFHFIDHNLPTDTAENFVKEFKKRINSKNIEYIEDEEVCFGLGNTDKNKWYINYYSNKQKNFIVIDVYFHDDNNEI